MYCRSKYQQIDLIIIELNYNTLRLRYVIHMTNDTTAKTGAIFGMLIFMYVHEWLINETLFLNVNEHLGRFSRFKIDGCEKKFEVTATGFGSSFSCFAMVCKSSCSTLYGLRTRVEPSVVLYAI